MDSLMNEPSLYHEEPGKTLQPWQVINHPTWRFFWRDSFPRKGPYMQSDRCTFEGFVDLVKTYISKQDAADQGVLASKTEAFSLSTEQVDALRKILDPWGSGLVSVEQVNYAGQFLSAKFEDLPLKDLVLELIKFEWKNMPLAAQRLDPGSLKDREKFIGDVAYRLTPGEKTKVAILFGIEGIGKSASAIRIVQALHDQLQFQKYTFFCDVKGCSTPLSLMCKLAHTMGYIFTGEQDPNNFFTWIRQYHIHDTLFVLDNMEKTSTSFNALAELINDMLSYSSRMRIIITTRSSGLKSALASNGMSPRAIEEIAIDPLTLADARELFKQLTGYDEEQLSKIQIPLVPADVHFIANAIRKNLFDVAAETRTITRQVVLENLLKRPLTNKISMPWAPTDDSARSLISILLIYTLYFDLKSATSLLTNLTGETVDEDLLELVCEELEARMLIREVTGRPHGKKYMIYDFVRVHINTNFPMAPSLADSIREHHVRYFAELLTAAGTMALSSDLSAGYQMFDENYGSMITLLFGPWAIECFSEYYQVARKAHKILRYRLSPGDQIYFYERVIESLNPDLTKYENVLVAAYLKCRISAAQLTLGNISEAKAQAKTALTAINSRSVPSHNASLEQAVQEYTALAIEREAEAYASPQLIEKALDIKRVVYGDHPETCQTLYNLAKSFELSGEDNRALEIYQFASEMMLKVLGKHPLTALVLNNIGNLLKDSKKYGPALEMYKSSILMRKETLGLRHPLVGQSYHNIAMVILDMPGDRNNAELEQARKYSQQAVNILSMSYEAGHTAIKNAVGLWDAITRIISSRHSTCQLCKQDFTLLNRRHRCRSCGTVICERCSPARGFRPVPDMGHSEAVRVCYRCSTDLA
eukprot:TRINITY_DN3621_c0_g1_i1.p1 TRINITY_DN3621_c0_g1~~TRINITY_DN3621_c0_g1_i1.p1  ORF type:complete len:875 (+),score=169.77 TRINITY_DN3621_c0_g1_i1:59-2683(+)